MDLPLVLDPTALRAPFVATVGAGATWVGSVAGTLIGAFIGYQKAQYVGMALGAAMGTAVVPVLGMAYLAYKGAKLLEPAQGAAVSPDKTATAPGDNLGKGNTPIKEATPSIWGF